jgi:hypothetical protein
VHVSGSEHSSQLAGQDIMQRSLKSLYPLSHITHDKDVHDEQFELHK